MLRGEIWLVEYDHPTEPGEPSKARPAVIVSADRFNQTKAWTAVAVPVTSSRRGNPLHVELDVPELHDVSYAQVELVGAVSRRRLVRRLGRLDPFTLDRVDERLAMVLSL